MLAVEEAARQGNMNGIALEIDKGIEAEGFYMKMGYLRVTEDGIDRYRKHKGRHVDAALYSESLGGRRRIFWKDLPLIG